MFARAGQNAIVSGGSDDRCSEAPAVLVLEDDGEARLFVAEVVREVGAEVVAVETLGEARTQLAGRAWDLLVLDRMLPDGSSLDWIRDIRASGDAVPILVLTALREVGERVDGLESGADDYLGKPFAALELKARVRALLRRGRRSRRQLTSGRLRIDGDRREAFVDGAELPLTERELRVLEQLVTSPALRRDELLETVWGEATAETGSSLDVILSRLRRKLAAHGLPESIETIRGYGLRWKGDG